MAEKPVCAWMPGCLDCPMARHPNEDNIYIRELIFAYDCPEDCADCSIVKKVNRHMIPRVARQEIDEALLTAESKGCDALYIHFTGGDPFGHAEDFRDICDYAAGLRSSVRIGLYAVTAFRSITPEALAWLRRLSGVLKLGIRYDRLRLDGDIPKEYPSLFKDCGYELILCVERENIGAMMQDIAAASALDVPVRLEYGDMRGWTLKDADAYLNAIAAERETICASPRLSGCFASLICEGKCHERVGSVIVNAVDTTGVVYLCSRCSPLRLRQKQLEARELRALVENYRKGMCARCKYGELCSPCSGELHTIARGRPSEYSPECLIMRIHRSLIKNMICKGEQK